MTKDVHTSRVSTDQSLFFISSILGYVPPEELRFWLNRAGSGLTRLHITIGLQAVAKSTARVAQRRGYAARFSHFCSLPLPPNRSFSFLLFVFLFLYHSAPSRVDNRNDQRWIRLTDNLEVNDFTGYTGIMLMRCFGGSLSSSQIGRWGTQSGWRWSVRCRPMCLPLWINASDRNQLSQACANRVTRSRFSSRVRVMLSTQRTRDGTRRVLSGKTFQFALRREDIGVYNPSDTKFHYALLPFD